MENKYKEGDWVYGQSNMSDISEVGQILSYNRIDCKEYTVKFKEKTANIDTYQQSKMRYATQGKIIEAGGTPKEIGLNFDIF